MVAMGMVHFLQQIGAILLLVFLLDLLIQWIQKLGEVDYPSQMILKEVRDERNEAWDRSIKILAKLDEVSEPWMQSISFYTYDLGDSNQFVDADVSARVSNPRDGHEIILESPFSRSDETEDFASELVLDVEVEGS